MITLSDVVRNDEIATMVDAANNALATLGYTEHGPRHVGYVSRTAANIMRELGYPERTVELAAIAGWVHDVGNGVNRRFHGITGANILMPVLLKMNMPMTEICQIILAVGNHEEEYGKPMSEISAALIIADKSDAHRTRVRKGDYDPDDIHDRVNYSIKENRLVIDKINSIIRFDILMDESSSVMEYFEIYLDRMKLAEQAANFLHCRYEFMVNGVRINSAAAVKRPTVPPLKEGETEVSV